MVSYIQVLQLKHCNMILIFSTHPTRYCPSKTITFKPYLLFSTHTHTCLPSAFLSLGFRTQKWITVTSSTNMRHSQIFLPVITINQPCRHLLYSSSYAVTTDKHCQRFERLSFMFVKSMTLWPSETSVATQQSTWHNNAADLDLQHNRWKIPQIIYTKPNVRFSVSKYRQTIRYIQVDLKCYVTVPSSIIN